MSVLGKDTAELQLFEGHEREMRKQSQQVLDFLF